MYFCARVVEYINNAFEPLNVIGNEDIEKVADSFCKGDDKLRPNEFDPFVQLEMPELEGEDLMAMYYAVAQHDVHIDKLFVDIPDEVRKRRFGLLRELTNRHVIQEKPDGTVRLRMGLFAKYLRENPNLTIEDLRSAKGWYHDR